ncbi:MAG: homocysteine S-methyltransferase family protein [Clostridia bacterium]|nr:homocysteine S-methyltransferase family protein [Clostridia bacterium]
MRIGEFKKRASEGVILLDGATGSNLRLAGMPVGVSTEQWVYDHPEAILRLQRAYVEAGSDIIYAPTFMANRIGLGMHGIEDRLKELNTGLVRLSKEAADGRALVAGDITTTGKPLEPVGPMSYQALFDVYREQIEALAEAGVDLLVAETMMAIDETVCAVEAAMSVCDLPIMCSLTMEGDGHLLLGGSAAEAVETLQALGACAVGLNCSVGPDQLEAVVRGMKAVAEVPVIAKPNAGVPVMDEHGTAHYSMSPEDFARSMVPLVAAGAGIVGGCCGTNPDYIRALRDAVRA